MWNSLPGVFYSCSCEKSTGQWVLHILLGATSYLAIALVQDSSLHSTHLCLSHWHEKNWNVLFSQSWEKKVECQQHPVFPGGHPSKYWLGSTLLNFSDRTRTGVFNVIWPLARERVRIRILELVSSLFLCTLRETRGGGQFELLDITFDLLKWFI